MDERTQNYSPTDLESADAETLARIALARSMTGSAAEPRIASFGSIGELLALRVSEHSQKPWLIFHDPADVRDLYTYGDFDDLIRTLASAMLNILEIAPGDRIATLMVNDPRTVLIYFAAWSIGATVVPINCGEEDERVSYILENSGAVACFCLDDHADRLENARSGCVALKNCIQVEGAPRHGFHNFLSLLDQATPLDSYPHVERGTEALIVYTSGTTGAPKGVVLDHSNLLADAQSIADWHQLEENERALNVLPIHHVNGIVVTLMTPLISGGSVVLSRKFSASAFWRTIADEQCSWVSVVPTVLAFLCEQPGYPRLEHDLSKLRHIVCGAGPLTCELARKFYDRFGVRIVHGYGLSETTCYSCFLPIDLPEYEYRSWMFECGFPSIGCPISANAMAIHDERGNTLGEDQRGEIVARGQNVMKYYFKRPDANRDPFAHGWFRSGDEGFRRKGEDGRDYYFITGRIKELIIRGGVNISPFDIDEVLSQAPGVKAAMAVGFENDFYGEEVGAYVQLEDGAMTTAEDILKFCRERLPYSKAPKVVVFGDTFPVTSTGKYQRNKLKPLFAEWKSAEFREKR